MLFVLCERSQPGDLFSQYLHRWRSHWRTSRRLSMWRFGFLLLLLFPGVIPSDDRFDPPTPPLRMDREEPSESMAMLLQPRGFDSGINSELSWRHTRYGWEQSNYWFSIPDAYPPALHPIVVGLLEVFLSWIALLAFSTPGKVPPQRGTRRLRTTIPRADRRVFE